MQFRTHYFRPTAPVRARRDHDGGHCVRLQPPCSGLARPCRPCRRLTGPHRPERTLHSERSAPDPTQAHPLAERAAAAAQAVPARPAPAPLGPLPQPAVAGRAEAEAEGAGPAKLARLDPVVPGQLDRLRPGVAGARAPLRTRLSPTRSLKRAAVKSRWRRRVL